MIYSDPIETTLAKLDHINGVLYPGGGGDYLEVGRQVLHNIMERNDNGTYYPIWATCLGYEYMAIYTSEAGNNALSEILIDSASVPLQFIVDPR